MDKLNIRNYGTTYSVKKISIDVSQDGENWERYSEDLFVENKKGMQSIAIVKKKGKRKKEKPFSFIRTNFIENYGNDRFIALYQLEILGC